MLCRFLFRRLVVNCADSKRESCLVKDSSHLIGMIFFNVSVCNVLLLERFFLVIFLKISFVFHRLPHSFIDGNSLPTTSVTVFFFGLFFVGVFVCYSVVWMKTKGNGGQRSVTNVTSFPLGVLFVDGEKAQILWLIHRRRLTRPVTLSPFSRSRLMDFWDWSWMAEFSPTYFLF